LNDEFAKIIAESKTNTDVCTSALFASRIFRKKSQIQLLANGGQHGCKQRFVTEIVSSNLELCRELAGVTDLRHVSGIKGIIAIVDDEFIAAVPESQGDDDHFAFTRYANAALIEQQNFLFDMLWHKAIPASQRIQQLEQGIPAENTELIQGTDNIVRRQVEGLISTKKQHDACCDENFPISLLSSEPVWKMCEEMQKRGILFRTITEITPRNIEQCKKMLTRMDLRHLSDIKGNFSIEDRSTYLGAATMRPGEPPTQGILSTSKIFVEMQQYFFDTLWNKAIPAAQRIREIEEGVDPEVIETFSDASKTQDFATQIISRAEKELLIMFASANEYRRQIGEQGFLASLSQLQGAKQNLSVRITMPEQSHPPRPEASENDGKSEEKFAIRRFEAALGTMITIIIVDRKYAIAMELKDDTSKMVSGGSVGLAIYSNNKALVMSYVSIFELLWTHIELYREIKMREEAQKEFIDIAVHELRAPIQPILGLAEEIQSRQNENPQGRLLGIILRSAANLQSLADNLLDVARIQNNSLRLNLTGFDLNELMSSLLADYAIDAARNRGIGMEFVRSKYQIYIVADRDRLSQVLSNCLQNSVRFTENGRIVVSAIRQGDSTVVSIKDSGSGIDPEILPRLFTKFGSSVHSRGTGLGLFISKKIIEAHGGQITGVNNIGESGATFTFSIPLNTRPQSAFIEGEKS
jgi:signal transduction histidine kinase